MALTDCRNCVISSAITWWKSPTSNPFRHPLPFAETSMDNSTTLSRYTSTWLRTYFFEGRYLCYVTKQMRLVVTTYLLLAKFTYLGPKVDIRIYNIYWKLSCTSCIITLSTALSYRRTCSWHQLCLYGRLCWQGLLQPWNFYQTAHTQSKVSNIETLFWSRILTGWS